MYYWKELDIYMQKKSLLIWNSIRTGTSIVSILRKWNPVKNEFKNKIWCIVKMFVAKTTIPL